MTIQLIGVCGRKRAGKDEIGKHLRTKHGFQKESFAWPLKEAVKIIYGWGDRHVDGDLKEVEDDYWKTTPRKVLQLMGTECGRQLDVDLWVKSLRLRLKTAMESPSASHKVVLTDVRFENEALAVRSLGGRVWRVIRPSLGERTDLHASETGLDHFVCDRDILNDGSLEDLYATVDSLLGQ